jgi:flagellar biosynthesis protein FlhG
MDTDMPEPTQGTQHTQHIKPAEIWAAGGGKGGTGKTFVISQLAISLASRGKKVILVDADFGGANIHTFFGIKKPPVTITHFFDKGAELSSLVLKTDVPNLSLIAGNSSTVSPANIRYAQKTKFFRHIKHLDADYVLLDLGGGTTMDTIDSFLLADKLVAVVVPEITAIENLYQFIKSVYFRRLKMLLGDHGLKDKARDVWVDRANYGIRTIVDLLEYLKDISPGINEVLTKELADFSLNIVLNKVRNVREVQEGFSIKSVCIKYIGVEARYAGYIEYDFQFWRNLSLIQKAPRFVVSHSTQNDVMKIAGNIMEDEQMKIDSLRTVW